MRVEKVEAERAKERQLAALKQNAVPQKVAERDEVRGDARAIAAAKTGANHTYISNAKKLAKEAPDVAEAADIRQGTRRDAVLFSVGANASHGLRRTNEDKRRAVTVLLSDEEWNKWPQAKIAARVYVNQLSKEVSSKRLQDTVRTAERYGVTYEIDTSNIGKQPAEPPAPIEVRPTSGAANMDAKAPRPRLLQSEEEQCPERQHSK